MSVDVREMVRADVSRVHEIECECFLTPWSKAALLGELHNDAAHYHVAERDGKIVGYAGMWVLFDEAHMTNIAVTEAYRRQGVAEELMLSMMACAARLRATMMTLEVREHNQKAQNLYYKLDFAQNGYRPRYYGDTGEGALILWNMDIQKTLQRNGRK